MSREAKELIDMPGNAVFERYLALYADIEAEYMRAVEGLGLPFAPRKTATETEAVRQKVRDLELRGLRVENGGRSLHLGWISPACVQCRKGLNTLTLGLSTQCPRKCYFCFNVNQRDHDKLQGQLLDAKAELDSYYSRGADLEHIALTGGEPLVHKKEALEFFAYARKLYPDAYLRLYTSGIYLDKVCLDQLRAVHLDEIRFSVKVEEPRYSHDKMIALMGAAADYIPQVMVEMPVAPDQVDFMKELLVRLDAQGIRGINLLEFCYPLNNAHEFAKRGYAIKNPPYQVYYDYEYAGGVPIDGSEEACIELLEFALEHDLGLGCHYCSLENKFTSQMYLQNAPYREAFPFRTFVESGYVFKSAKAFGEDAKTVAALSCGADPFPCQVDETNGYAEFPLDALAYVHECYPDMEIGISTGVVEPVHAEARHSSANKTYRYRELKIDLTAPNAFMGEVAEEASGLGSGVS